MCGIIGIAYPMDRAPPAAERESRLDMTHIRNRGPDGEGVWSKGSVTLGHTHLAVIDSAQSARQPITDGNLALVCNGEIYNHDNLRRRHADYPYSTTSDCEAILASYRDQGATAWQQLDGMFACALYDHEQRALHLARDRVGKKPIFYLHQNGVLIFASSVTAVVANAQCRLTANVEQLQYFLAQGFLRPVASLFEQIKPVLPGQIITYQCQTGQLNISAIADSEPAETVPTHQEEILERIEQLFDDSLRKRAGTLRKRTILFSGGIDSTYLAARSTKLFGRCQLLSMRQPMPWMHDAPRARRAARMLGQPLTFIGRTLSPSLQDVAEALRLLDQPLAVPSYYSMTPLALAARDHGNVLLTGDGADEAFFGYIPSTEWFSPEVAISQHWIQSGPGFVTPLSQTGRYLAGSALVGHQFVKIDKASAENAMEARCPFQDWRLLRFLRALPAEFWTAFAEVKGVLKTLLRRQGLPASLVSLRKIGTSYPIRYLLASSIPKMRGEVHERRDWLQAAGGILPRSALEAFRNFPAFFRLWVLTRFVNLSPNAVRVPLLSL